MNPEKIAKRLSILHGRACLWETRSKRAALQGDLDKAGRNRTKALQIMAEAQGLERKSLHQSTEQPSVAAAEGELK